MAGVENQERFGTLRGLAERLTDVLPDDPKIPSAYACDALSDCNASLGARERNVREPRFGFGRQTARLNVP